MDEVESLLKHFDSETIDNKRGTFNLMMDIVQVSTKVLALDGDYGNRAHHFLQRFDPKTKEIENVHKNIGRTLTFVDNIEYFNSQLDQDIMKGKKIVICSMSSKIANEYSEILSKRKIKGKEIKVVLHTAKSGDDLKKQLMNVNEYWKNFQVVIYSPSLESGVDFSEFYFDKLYAILATDSTSQRGFLQMCSRVRKLTDGNIFVYTNGLQFTKYESFYTYNDAKEFMEQIHNNYSLDQHEREIIDNKLMIKDKELELYDENRIYNECENLK